MTRFYRNAPSLLLCFLKHLKGPALTAFKDCAHAPAAPGIYLRFAACLAGSLLRAISFPVSLHSLVMDAAELSLYLGAADGRVFEVTLAGQPQLPDQATAVAAAGPVTGSEGVASGRQWNVMEGHSRTVTCMAMTVDGAYMLSGGRLFHPADI